MCLWCLSTCRCCHKLLTLLQELCCHVWFLCIHICLTGGILTWFGTFMSCQVIHWHVSFMLKQACLCCHVWFMFIHIWLTGVLLTWVAGKRWKAFSTKKCCVFQCFEMSWWGSLEVKYLFFAVDKVFLKQMFAWWKGSIQRSIWKKKLQSNHLRLTTQTWSRQTSGTTSVYWQVFCRMLPSLLAISSCSQ